MHFPVWQHILQLLSRDLHIAFKWLLAGCLQNSAVLESGHHPSAAVVQSCSGPADSSLQTAQPQTRRGPGGDEGGREGGRAPAAAFPQNLVSADKNFMESWQSGGVAGWLSRGQPGPITTASVWLSLYLKKNVPS